MKLLSYGSVRLRGSPRSYYLRRPAHFPSGYQSSLSLRDEEDRSRTVVKKTASGPCIQSDRFFFDRCSMTPRGANGRIKLSKHHVLLSNAIPRLRPILRTDSSRSRKKEVPRKEFFNSDAQFERITPYKVLHVETP